ncbi:hypothetical protein D3C83_164360 [compost metagenome]
MNRSRGVITALPMENEREAPNADWYSGVHAGRYTGAEPCATRTKFWSTIDIPIALMSGDSAGAWRRGR